MSDYLEPFLCLYAYVFSLCCPFYGLCSGTGYLPGYICSCTLHAFQTFALVLLIVHSRSADPYCGDHLLYCTIHRYTFLKWNDNTLLYLACGPPAVCHCGNIGIRRPDLRHTRCTDVTATTTHLAFAPRPGLALHTRLQLRRLSMTDPQTLCTE